jgi:hypothetical protein
MDDTIIIKLKKSLEVIFWFPMIDNSFIIFTYDERITQFFTKKREEPNEKNEKRRKKC